MTHRFNLLLLAVLCLVGVPWYWLMVANPGRHPQPHPLHIAQLRTLADALPGPRPRAVEAREVGWKRVVGNLYAAGSGLKDRRLSVLAYRLVVPGRGGITIDGGTTGALAPAMGLAAFVPAAQRRVDEWMSAADVLLATSERPAHMGGMAMLATRPGSARAMARARLNAWQVPRETADDRLPWPSTLVLRAAITDTRPMAIAPGVVVIPTGVPSPGSQMIYARLADGREYLFAGDVAPFATNLAELRVSARLLKDRGGPAIRAETMRWLVTLRRLVSESPKLKVVPAHDLDWLQEATNHTGIEVIRP